MKREEKNSEVSFLTKRLAQAKAVILAEYRGLKVSEITEIRREVKKNAGEFKVVKNRLAKRAVQGSPFAPLETHFRGPLVIAATDQDPVVLSKILAKFAESFQALKLKVGCLDGRLLEFREIQALAKLPSKEELYAKLLGTLLATAGGLVRVLNGVPQKLAICLRQIGEKKE